MKKYLLVVMLFSYSIFLHAQTLEEWTQQKKTQIKYLLQQIAALKVYTDYAEKGYDIAKKGLNTIKDIKNGDFNLHEDFFASLRNVNPAIKNSAKVAGIIAFQIQVLKDAKSIQQDAKESNQFTDQEISYFKNVFDHLLDESAKNLDELVTITTSGELEMKDDERIKQIDKIYDDMQDKVSFSKSFSKEAALLAIQRMVEQNEVDRSRKLYGLQ